jgi:hypothetical protein
MFCWFKTLKAELYINPSLILLSKLDSAYISNSFNATIALYKNLILWLALCQLSRLQKFPLSMGLKRDAFGMFIT